MRQSFVTPFKLSLSLFATLLLGAGAAEAQVLVPNLIYTSLQGCRAFDTRSSTAGKLVHNVTQTFNIVGNGNFSGQGGSTTGCNVPGFGGIPSAPQVQAVMINLAVVNSSGAGDLKAWSSDQSAPPTTTINYSGVTIANAIVVPVRQDSAGGDISLRADVSDTDALGDVVGYFSYGSPTPSGGSENLILGGNAGNISHQTGDENAAYGWQTLFHNTTGSENTAIGTDVLYENTTGSQSVGVGMLALELNTTGSSNTALGAGALEAVTTGSGNIGVGFIGGELYTSGDSYNIAIGNIGVSGESGVIRIGTGSVHSKAFIAGISGATSSSGSAVYVNSSGQLGTTTSSLRFKEDVRDMGEASEGLMQLRPVSFHYRPQYDDGSHILQYGLIAEEVAKIYPGLVQYDNDGRPLSVRYQFVNAMLLNEVQRQRQESTRQEAQLAEQRVRIERLERQLQSLIQGRDSGRQR
jgi:Chaperone of endosialidase